MKKRFWQQLLINIINFILYVAFIEAIIRFVTPIPAICITLPVYLIILHTKSPNLLFSLFLIGVYYAYLIVKKYSGLAAPAIVFLTIVFLISESMIFVLVKAMKQRRIKKQ